MPIVVAQSSRGWPDRELGVAAGVAQLIGELPHPGGIGARIGLCLGELCRQCSGVDTNLQGKTVSHGNSFS
jgi:hypothetical protein